MDRECSRENREEYCGLQCHSWRRADGSQSKWAFTWGRAADRTTENNLLFNNRLENLSGRSAILIKKYARDNYISQSILRGNDVKVRNWTRKSETNGFREQSGFHSPAAQ